MALPKPKAHEKKRTEQGSRYGRTGGLVGDKSLHSAAGLVGQGDGEYEKLDQKLLETWHKELHTLASHMNGRRS